MDFIITFMIIATPLMIIVETYGAIEQRLALKKINR